MSAKVRWSKIYLHRPSYWAGRTELLVVLLTVWVVLTSLCGHAAWGAPTAGGLATSGIANDLASPPGVVIVTDAAAAQAGDLLVLPDPEGQFTIEQVAQAEFQPYRANAPVNRTIGAYWIKLTLAPASPAITETYLNLGQWDTIEAYGDGFYQRTGMLVPLRERPVTKNFLNHPLLYLTLSSPQTYFFRVQTDFSKITIQRPFFKLELYSQPHLYSLDFWIGIYCGWLLVMALYNLFIFISIRNDSYLYYTLYLLFFALVWISFFGFGYQFFWADLSPHWNKLSANVFGFPFFFFLVRFAQSFLRTRTYTPKLHRYLSLTIVAFCGSGVLFFTSAWFYGFVVELFSINAALILMLIAGIRIYRQGFGSARFFVLANLSFIIGGIIFNLADLQLIDQNGLTQFGVHIGSAIEAVLFSLGLADMINRLKNEKEEAQRRVIEQLRQNKVLQEKNQEELEEKVRQRTQELSQLNRDLTYKTTELEATLERLRDTQTQLVESEKMASLGQLTAGIAHEINNPVNFITSNIDSLKLDFQDLSEVINTYMAAQSEKALAEAHMQARATDTPFLFEEISGLIKGIAEGAQRTHEIVVSLRNFSRMDEDAFKQVNIHDGIDSTLALLKNKLKQRITVHRNYGQLPLVECLPGKLNQVFMNILTNAIQAIADTGTIEITTQAAAETVQISIKDSGTGMDADTQKRIFEPFYTTKSVGEGTGLGLSITYGIIERHHGQIEVRSQVGAGSEFVIQLPIGQPPIKQSN